MKVVKLVLFFASFSVIFGEKARFDHYRVYSIDVKTDEQLNVLQELENQQDGLTFTRPATATETLAEIIVPPHKFADISEFYEKFNLTNRIIIDDLQKSIQNSMKFYEFRSNQIKHFFIFTQAN